MPLPPLLSANGSQAYPPSSGSSFLIKLLLGYILVADPRLHACVLAAKFSGEANFLIFLYGVRTHKAGTSPNVAKCTKVVRQSEEL